MRTTPPDDDECEQCTGREVHDGVVTAIALIGILALTAYSLSKGVNGVLVAITTATLGAIMGAYLGGGEAFWRTLASALNQHARKGGGS